MNFSSSYNCCISSSFNYYPTTLRRVQMTPKTSTNITRPYVCRTQTATLQKKLFYEDFRLLLVEVVVKSYNDKLMTLNGLFIGKQIAISYYKKGKIGKICRTFSI